ncbi:winged helix-turn-helix transcriptional regulator [Lacticaseibacillus pabuli]|uniref:Winged helix-turn-helix transcriptional regulator n=1 Tax=Lacticaseibacillus pabuli TaxID=3025672 RepID=A0ABY7WWY4_9LACO|nr:winged helix-turn-helix transcriptional regulator [Lacticaseibacillus sp. KACC 23028]WDF83574.1 winged helix-turn-helix transcriptional regulator [Lacticaseibacillus sp. KACC 23028]
MQVTTTSAPCTNQKAKTICPHFSKAFMILGKKWNGLILDVLLDGPARFKDIAAAVTKCSDRVLVERLKELEADGLVQRVTHTDSALIEYQLTAKGAGLSDVLTAAHAWGDEWLTDEECVD